MKFAQMFTISLKQMLSQFHTQDPIKFQKTTMNHTQVFKNCFNNNQLCKEILEKVMLSQSPMVLLEIMLIFYQLLDQILLVLTL